MLKAMSLVGKVVDLAVVDVAVGGAWCDQCRTRKYWTVCGWQKEVVRFLSTCSNCICANITGSGR